MRRILWFLSLFMSVGCESSGYAHITLPQLGGGLQPAPHPPQVPPDAAIVEVEKTAAAPPAEPIPPPRAKPRAKSKGSTTTTTTAKPAPVEKINSRGRANGVACTFDSECADGDCDLSSGVCAASYESGTITCNDGTQSPTCTSCSSGCCSGHGGCE